MSLAAGAVCVRLGFWQLDRLHQRQARNAEARSRLGGKPIEVPPMSADLQRFQRVTARGVFDFEREFVVGGRARTGNPGVHIATPLRLAGTDTMLLVIRGWVYSPDAATVDLPAWREADTVAAEGYLVEFEEESGAADTTASGVVRRLVRPQLEQRVHAPLARYYLMMTAGGSAGDSVPRRIEEPVLDEGPHFSYAVQWFLFATIFGAGGVFVTFRRARTASANKS